MAGRPGTGAGEPHPAWPLPGPRGRSQSDISSFSSSRRSCLLRSNVGGSGKGVQGARERGEAAHRLPGPPERGSSWSFAPPARFGDVGLEAGPVRPSRLPAALGATLSVNERKRGPYFTVWIFKSGPSKINAYLVKAVLCSGCFLRLGIKENEILVSHFGNVCLPGYRSALPCPTAQTVSTRVPGAADILDGLIHRCTEVPVSPSTIGAVCERGGAAQRAPEHAGTSCATASSGQHGVWCLHLARLLLRGH